METEEKDKVSYSDMKTTARLNYRTACSFDADNIAGVLEKGTTVKVEDDSETFAHGYLWCKIRLGRKEYYVCTAWLESV